MKTTAKLKSRSAESVRGPVKRERLPNINRATLPLHERFLPMAQRKLWHLLIGDEWCSYSQYHYEHLMRSDPDLFACQETWEIAYTPDRRKSSKVKSNYQWTVSQWIGYQRKVKKTGLPNLLAATDFVSDEIARQQAAWHKNNPEPATPIEDAWFKFNSYDSRRKNPHYNRKLGNL